MTDISKQDEAVVKNIEALNSGNPLFIKNTLVDIRENGHPDYIPVLIDLIAKHKDTELVDIIKAFISDIKDSSIKQILLDSINNDKNVGIKKDLLSICWESAIDFSEHLDLFVDIVINDGFDSSFEALTVIENLDKEISEDIINSNIDRLKAAISDADESKKYVLHETIGVLQKRIA